MTTPARLSLILSLLALASCTSLGDTRQTALDPPIEAIVQTDEGRQAAAATAGATGSSDAGLEAAEAVESELSNPPPMSHPE